MKPSRVTVFCSSSQKVSPIYFSEMEILATGLAKHGIDIVFGGAQVGLMGCLANTALKNSGRVYGVIPEYLNKPGIVHENLTELMVVNDLLDRKRKMIIGSDAVIAFPGGIGTIDEITEILALKQLGEFNKRIYFINFLDSWQMLFDCFKELKERDMIMDDLDHLYVSFDTSQELLKSWGL
jgi:uncharacterized protein (TIGR00730 family)